MKARVLILAALPLFPLHAQEADAGFDLRATLTAAGAASNALASRGGPDVVGGFRGVFYPTLKLSRHWSVSGAYQVESRVYCYQSFGTPGYGAAGRLLQGNLTYSDFWSGGSLVVRAGQLSSAFGSFPLRYDDAENPLIDVPLEYGYYYNPVSISGLAGVQVDITRNKIDLRAQLANSSPVNPRSIFSHDQYANWAGGVGYTIRQGLRIGASGYRGPYLDRQLPFFFPGEAAPDLLPARGLGLDVQWAAGHWNIQGELQKFLFSYRAIPAVRENAGYVEAKRVLHPRWYVAVRGGYATLAPYTTKTLTFETTAGYRPASHELVKVGYEIDHYPSGRLDRTLQVELVSTIHPLSLAWR